MLSAEARDAVPSNCSLHGSTLTCSFGYTGGAQTWTVPSDVTTATFDVEGAQGGFGGGVDNPVWAVWPWPIWPWSPIRR